MYNVQLTQRQVERQDKLSDCKEGTADTELQGQHHKAVDLELNTRPIQKVLVNRTLDTTDQDNEQFLKRFQAKVKRYGTHMSM